MTILSVASNRIPIIIAEVIAADQTHATGAAPCMARTRHGITHLKTESLGHRTHRHDSAGPLVSQDSWKLRRPVGEVTAFDDFNIRSTNRCAFYFYQYLSDIRFGNGNRLNFKYFGSSHHNRFHLVCYLFAITHIEA